MSGRVILAVVGAPHGVRGEARVKLFAESIDSLAAYGPLTSADGRVFTVLSARPLKDDMAVVRFREITSREAAERINRVELGVARSALPDLDDEDEVYHADLVGLAAETPAGAPLGRVIAVHDHGAGDMLEVAGTGPSKLYPFTKAVVPTIDLAGGRIVIEPPFEIEGEAG